jgi:hypothetical protein
MLAFLVNSLGMQLTDCNGDPLSQDEPVSGKVTMGNINLFALSSSSCSIQTRHLTCPSSPSVDSYHRFCTYPPAFASESHYVRSIYPDPRFLRSTT